MFSNKIYILLFATINFMSCGIYSFTGASIPPDAKTVSVAFFKNQAQIIQPSLSQGVTEDLKDKIISRTTLDLINGIGDLHFEGIITSYVNQPMGIVAGEQAALNRLTITVSIKYISSIDETLSYNTTFSRYADYPSSSNLNDVELALNDEIIDLLTEDIFNKSFVNW